MAKTRYKIEKLSNADFAQNFRDKAKTNPEMEGREDRWNTLKKTITKRAEEALGVRKSYGGKKKQPHCGEKNIQDSVERKIKSFRRWMKMRSTRVHMISR